MRNILIIGATSGIGRDLALQYAAKGFNVAATGRRVELLETLKEAAPQQIKIYVSDVKKGKAIETLEQITKDMGEVDTIILCAGMGDINLELRKDIELDTVLTNVYGFTDWADAGYLYLQNRYAKTGGEGRIAGLSSIASLRGSDAAPAYFASKAYVSNYLEGLRKKAVINKISISVTTLIPGFVDTVLAKGVGGKGLFWVAPVDKAARQIITAIEAKRSVAYITKRWRFIAWILKITPPFLYNRVH